MIRMLLALLAACLLAATAAAQEHVIRIWGPDAMREVAQRWADSYRAVHPELRFELTMKGSDTAMPGLYTGKADIALLARETTITDDNGFLRNKSYPPTRLELMRGSLATPGKAPALVLLVHAANPLRAITLDQITALFGCKGRAVRTWGDLGLAGGWKDLPIRIHMPDASSNTGRFFQDTAMAHSRKMNWSAIAEYPMIGGSASAYSGIASAVRQDRSAIGLGTLSDMRGLRVVPIIAAESSAPVAVNRETVQEGTYPFARHAYAFIDRKPGAPVDPVLAAFLRYTISPAGQAELGDWLPPGTEAMARNMAAISNSGEGPSATALAAVAQQPAYQPQRQVAGTISIWGHGSFKRDFMGKLVQRWFAEFNRFQPGAKLDYRMYGTASAIGALATGAGNLALLGEEISPEQTATFIRAKGYAPQKIELANGSVATSFFDYAHMIFVRRDNPLTGLTMQQLEGIYGAEMRCGGRQIRTWGQLGLTGEWADKAIVPYVWETDTDFAQLLRERALCGSHRWNPATREVFVAKKADGSAYDLGQQLIDALGTDRFGIAASNVQYQTADVKPLPLAWRASGPFVTASDATLIDRSYPLGRIIPAYVDQRPGGKVDPVVAEFLRYILSREGQQALVEESAYLPLGPAVAARERKRVQ